MPIDPRTALAAAPLVGDIAWTDEDVRVYHRGIGARPDHPHPVPAFATTAGPHAPGVTRALTLPGIDVDLAHVLHGAQSLTLHRRPLPSAGTATTTARITAVHDKTKAAVLVMRTEAADTHGPLWTDEAHVYVRGEGGWGGDRGPATPHRAAPTAPPDHTLDRPTREDQALLHRLSGDDNPLHTDQDFAARAGFERPVLHGLCTYGMTLEAVVDTLLDGDVTRVRSYTARFAGIVYPGETLRIRMWRHGPRTVHVTVGAADRDDTPVLTATTVGHD
ncbi:MULTISPECIES: MaoC/PaaZ C-terminal domain-containing protein [Streptomyces]|uniref:MaoC/PaaZ C-terminal domain-containing protein n=1 Tax=Streptomyces edwardsiae TaxID=3075527 RepID=A0ABU2Q3V8_9ACTN|nr:MaoC/PaaZ C-terminal domain-containing protein [Streptomyces sp. DSM 41636]MDT0398731.1 MaoC/PaaZ C-terminal domain-containing protein [Streptomyces sp. DSM 41636]